MKCRKPGTLYHLEQDNTRMTQSDLSSGELHVWWSLCESVPGSAVNQLSLEEFERHARFHFESDRQSYAASHAMLRLLLVRYGSVHSKAYFQNGPHGKPFLPGDIQFNISHTRGLVACAFSTSAPVGVDVESLRRTNDWQRLLCQVQSDEEVEVLRALPEHEQQLQFYKNWTLKEAWSKATGSGLHTDFRSLNVLCPPQHLFLSLIDTVPDFQMAVSCLRRPSRLVSRRFDWNTS